MKVIAKNPPLQPSRGTLAVILKKILEFNDLTQQMKKRLKKKDLITVSLIFLIIAFIIPFTIRTEEESDLEVLTASITAIGALATFITLFIAIALYDRFGLETRFIGKQTDKVLELVDFLKGKYIIASTSQHGYMITTNRDKIEGIRKVPPYENDKSKKIIVDYDNYKKMWSKNLYEIKRSYWLPQKIKKKIEFLEISILASVEDPFNESYIRFFSDASRNKNADEPIEWKIIIPEITFEEFNNNLFNLTKTIEKWLKQHSDIKIDFNLAESEKYPEPKQQ